MRVLTKKHAMTWGAGILLGSTICITAAVIVEGLRIAFLICALLLNLSLLIWQSSRIQTAQPPLPDDAPRQNTQDIAHLKTLRNVSIGLTEASDLQWAWRRMIQAALALTPAEYAVMYVYVPQAARYVTRDSTRRDKQAYSDPDVLIPLTLVSQAMSQQSYILVEDIHNHPTLSGEVDLSKVDYRGVLVMPVGEAEVLCLLYQDHQVISASDVDYVTLLGLQSRSQLATIRLVNELRMEAQRMTAILDATDDGILLLDHQNRLLTANTSAERLLDYPLSDYIGEHFTQNMIPQMQERREINAQTQAALGQIRDNLDHPPERITRQEYALTTRKGRTHYVEEIGSPVAAAHHQGALTGRLLVLRDRTNEKQLAAYREEITQMLIHDLRGPLSAMISSMNLSLDIIEDPRGVPLEESLVATLNVSLESGKNLLRLVDSLMDIAKLENRSMSLDIEACSANGVVQDALEAMRAVFTASALHIQQRLTPNLPLVAVDHDKIRRVMINLLDNAAQHTPQGGEVWVETAQHGPRSVIVRVANSGRAIAKEERLRIFDKFHQIKDQRGLTGKKGTGLGLTFCKLTIEAHGGQIEVEPTGPLSGASFVFTIPIAPG